MDINLQVYLDQEIKKVCPIHGISFGNLDDKSTWEIQFKDEATKEQRQAALNYIQNFVLDNDKMKEAELKVMVDQYKGNSLYRKAYVDYKEKVPSASFEDFIKYLESIKV